MEQWIEIFAQSISSIDEDERNEANQNLLDHIQSLNPDFIKNSCLVLKTDSIDYNTRHAASVYLSRFFTIQSIKQKKQLDTFASNPSNKEIIADLIQTLFTIIHSDNSTLQRECIHIFSLLVYINIDGIFDNLYQLFSLFDCDEIEKKQIPLYLLYDLLNHCFINQILTNPQIREMFIAAHISATNIIAIPVNEQNLTNIKMSAAQALDLSLSVIPSFITEKESVFQILNAIPSSLTIPDINLFSTLHHIMLLLLINNYQNNNELLEILSTYLSNSLSMEQNDFLEIALNFLDDLTDFELNSVELQNTTEKESEEEYFSIKIFDVIFPYLINFILTGLKDDDNILFSLTLSIFRHIINLRPEKILLLFRDNIEEHINSEDFNDHFIILNLLALFGELKPIISHELDQNLFNYLQPKLPYLKYIISNSLEYPPMLKMSFICTSRLLYRFPEILENTYDPSVHVHDFIDFIDPTSISDPSLLVSYIDMICSFCKVFAPSNPCNPFTDSDLFKVVVSLFLQLFEYPEFENNQEVLNIVNKGIRIIIEHAYCLTDKKSLFQNLLEVLKTSLENENQFYQSLLCLMLYQIINFTKGYQLSSLFPETQEVLARILSYHNTLLFDYALPTFSITICYSQFSPDVFEQFIGFIHEGLDSCDPSIILYTCISLDKALIEHKINVFPWISDIFSHLKATLESVDDECRDKALPYLIRSISNTFDIANFINKSQNENTISFISENEEWMKLMIQHFGSEISYSTNFDDEREFADQMFGAISHAIGVFFEVFPPEGDHDIEKRFSMTVYKPFMRAFSCLLVLSDSSYRDLFFMLNNLSKYISKTNLGRFCDRQLQKKLHQLEISQNNTFAGDLQIIKKNLFGDTNFKFE